MTLISVALCVLGWQNIFQISDPRRRREGDVCRRQSQTSSCRHGNCKSETHISKKTTYTDEEWQKQLNSAGEEVEDAAEVEYN